MSSVPDVVYTWNVLLDCSLLSLQQMAKYTIGEVWKNYAKYR